MHNRFPFVTVRSTMGEPDLRDKARGLMSAFDPYPPLKSGMVSRSVMEAVQNSMGSLQGVEVYD